MRKRAHTGYGVSRIGTAIATGILAALVSSVRFKRSGWNLSFYSSPPDISIRLQAGGSEWI